MKIYVYAIGGNWNPGFGGDCLVGSATDTTTFQSLLDLTELKGGYAVSLHGTFGTDSNLPFISGEYTLTDARNLTKILEKYDLQRRA